MFKKYSTLILLTVLALFGLGGVFAYAICQELKDYFIQFYCAVLCGIFTFVSLYVTFAHDKETKEEDTKPKIYSDKIFNQFDNELTFSCGANVVISSAIIKIISMGGSDFIIDNIEIGSDIFLSETTSIIKMGESYLIKINKLYPAGTNFTLNYTYDGKHSDKKTFNI